MKTQSQLVHYDAARSALQKAHSVDEVKRIRDKAEALRVYARQANDTDMQNWAVEIKLRAERRAGELIKEQQAAKVLDTGKGGDRKSDHRRDVATLKSIGISRDQSSKWQKLAAVPEAKFERIIAETKEKAKELTSAAVLREARQLSRRAEAEPDANPGGVINIPPEAMKERAHDLWLFMLLSEDWTLDEPSELWPLLSSGERQAVVRVAKKLRPWLAQFVKLGDDWRTWQQCVAEGGRKRGVQCQQSN